MEMETRKSVMSSVNPLFFHTRFYYKSMQPCKENKRRNCGKKEKREKILVSFLEESTILLRGRCDCKQFGYVNERGAR